jgi:hypothetical protein
MIFLERNIVFHYIKSKYNYFQSIFTQFALTSEPCSDNILLGKLLGHLPDHDYQTINFHRL